MRSYNLRLPWLLCCLPLLLLAAAPAQARHHRHHHRLRIAGDQPDIRSTAALVLDEDSATVLLARQADVPTPIASITKLMTAIVVLEAKQSLDETLQITEEDHEHGRGAFSRLTIGTKLSRGDLMHVALMSSENRAAHALGRNYPGGLSACVAAMNAKARALGMKNAHFVDPTGLDSGNVASPSDLAKLVIAASHVATIQEYSTDRMHALRVGRRELEFRNTDLLVRSPAWNIVVQKTGYITEAGKCLVMKAVIRDRPVVIVLLDSYGKYTRVADAQRIRKWLESRTSESATPAVVASKAAGPA